MHNETTDIAIFHQQVLALPEDEIRQRFGTEWITGTFMSWRAVMMLGEIDRAEMWKGSVAEDGRPYTSLNEWILTQNLPGLKSQSTVSRLVNVSRWFRDLHPEAQKRWILQSVWDAAAVTQVVVNIGEEKAYQIASSKKTHAQKRQEARKLVSKDQHIDTSGRKVVQFNMTGNQHKQVAMALNAAKHMLQDKAPNDANALEAMATDFLSGFASSALNAIETNLDYMSTTDRAMLIAEMHDDILSGRMKCANCNAWWPIHRHHCPPRSHNIERADGTGMWNPDDVDWPCVYLCMDCHAKVHDGDDWRRWAKHWAGSDRRFEARLGRFLGGRRIEDI